GVGAEDVKHNVRRGAIGGIEGFKPGGGSEPGIAPPVVRSALTYLRGQKGVAQAVGNLAKGMGDARGEGSPQKRHALKRIESRPLAILVVRGVPEIHDVVVVRDPGTGVGPGRVAGAGEHREARRGYRPIDRGIITRLAAPAVRKTLVELEQ